MVSDSPAAPAAASPQGQSGEVQRLKSGAVGLFGVIFMAVATAAPIAAMTGNVPPSVAFGTGTSTPGGYVIATIVLGIFAVGYVSMARYITTTGAFYGYISQGLGRIIGMSSGMLTVVAYMVFEASLVGLVSSFAQSTFESQAHVHVPWLLVAAIVIVTNSTLSYFDIDFAVKVLGVLLLGEILALGSMAVSVLIHGGGPNGIPLKPISPFGALHGINPGFGLFFAFWSWVGFESTAMYGEESRNPRRIVPIATLVSVIGIGLFYTFVSWMAISGNGLSQSISIAKNDPFGLIFDPLGTYVGPWAVHIAAWLMITGSFACGLAFHNCASRYLYAIGREGILNRRLGRTHPKHRSPYIASLTQSVFTAILVGLFALFHQDPYGSLYTLCAIFGTAMILIVQTMCSFAVIGYFHTHQRQARHWLTHFLAPLVGGLGMLGVVILLFKNIDAAAGPAASTPFFKAIPYLVAAIGVFGVLLAVVLRARRPQIYAILGRIVLTDTGAEEESNADLHLHVADSEQPLDNAPVPAPHPRSA